MVLQPCVSFNRNCQEAVSFYRDIFGTDLSELELFGDMDLEAFSSIQSQQNLSVNQTPTKVTYGQLPPKELKPKNENLTLVIMSDNINELHCLYTKLQDQGCIKTSFMETDWSKAYAVIVDRFGVEWQLNYQEA
ncbi:VOC family protein [Eubacteriaceae bacterium ES3]|nr:VOC family protein [Eubacteriaceae bacterium ES3]